MQFGKNLISTMLRPSRDLIANLYSTKKLYLTIN
jgi:hypothetical protein